MSVDQFGADIARAQSGVGHKMTVDERWSVFEIECKYFLSYYIVLNIFTPYHFAFLQLCYSTFC